MTRPLSELRGPVRALFSDVDGTMTTGERIEASTYAALEQLGDAGHPGHHGDRAGPPASGTRS